MSNQTGDSSNIKVSFKIDTKIAAIVLLITNLITLMFWKPWQGSAELSSLSSKGEATLKVEPDQFEFYVNYNEDADDTEKALEKITSKSQSVIEGLKSLGLKDEQIETNLSTYDDLYYIEKSDDKTVGNLSITITIDDKDLAQKVQDYLITTSPDGSVSPYPSLSQEKQKQLTDEARSAAIDNARKNAEQTAEKLGVKIDKVTSYSEEEDSFGIPYALDARSEASSDSLSISAPSIDIMSGLEEFTYRVNVIYSVK